MDSELHDLRAQLSHKERRLQLISRVTGTVFGAVSLPDLARQLARQVREAFQIDAAVIRLLDGEDLILFANDGLPPSDLQDRIAANLGLGGEILAKDCPIAVSDVSAHPLTRDITQPVSGRYEFRSYAGVPLRIENRPIGILGIYCRHAVREFNQEDLDHLSIVANHVAVAVHNQRLYRELAERKAELETTIEQRARAEEQLLQSQKLDALGRLAGGIAHDFNNMLAVINGYSELLLAMAEPGSVIEKGLNEMLRAGQRAAQLTQQLLAFGRRQMLTLSLLDLNEMIRSMLEMLQRLVGEDIELIFEAEPRLFPVRADRSKLDQVLMNLTVNARDAMPRGGSIRVHTRNVEIAAGEPAEVPPGRWVAVHFADNGAGMSVEALTRIFDPFYTTKDLGKGTGLGMAVVHGIIDQSRGHVRVTSAPGEGAEFRIYLPAEEQ